MPRPGPEAVDALRRIELFAGLGEEELGWLAVAGKPVTLADGEVLFEDGQRAEHFYVLLAGELLISKMIGGRTEVVARHSADAVAAVPSAATPGAEPEKPVAAHQFTGELPMLAGGGYVARGTAVGATELLAYDQETFLEMIVRCPRVCRVLLPVLAWRIRSYELQAGRRALLDGLGSLAAGLAHELNNPTAALVQAARELGESVRELAGSAVRWGRLATDDEDVRLGRLAERARAAKRPLGPFDTDRTTDALAEVLAAHGVPGADETAAVLVEGGVCPDDLDRFADQVRTSALPAAVEWLAQGLRAEALVADVAETSGRISMLVRDTKAYTNLDRAPERAVDLTEGLDATLSMHAARLGNVQVRRDYAPDLPPVTAYPSELNQVWSNLIDNAVDAMDGAGVLRIGTRRSGRYAVVEIRDDGRGIPADAIGMLFQPFFTTKDIGKGTGLGLHLSHGIVTTRHRGTISVTSAPGDTCFTVCLPVE
ncbi:ATP-binding protein [Amycolatopsis dendrobii]|uniref:histidine kinase n=1 Tax=Amycolatopsis dendrobii TaxID=2760662 RepID=A0A7W3W0I3_9PSEU|nr:ATP-binding protein [Amycolatopsis dendrobii]MBB1156112.1 cyclic nucleotide-binding domain-containing protein [Amycolatopsis dendrobii]